MNFESDIPSCVEQVQASLKPGLLGSLRGIGRRVSDSLSPRESLLLTLFLGFTLEKMTCRNAHLIRAEASLRISDGYAQGDVHHRTSGWTKASK